MNARTRLLTLATVAAATLAPAMAVAHPGHGLGQTFAAGLMHPLSGLDHVLMIVAVSAWASAMQRPARLLVAACLALFVAVGALLPVALAPGPVLESALAFTVLGAGALLAMNRRWPTWASASLASMFALIHGLAHGAEGPADSLAYVPGLVLATGGLAVGVSIMAASLQSRAAWLRIVGVAGAVVGVATLFST
jgi:urease accessory protein